VTTAGCSSFSHLSSFIIAFRVILSDLVRCIAFILATMSRSALACKQSALGWQQMIVASGMQHTPDQQHSFSRPGEGKKGVTMSQAKEASVNNQTSTTMMTAARWGRQSTTPGMTFDHRPCRLCSSESQSHAVFRQCHWHSW
jgi:hypothetical protein